MSWKYPPTRRQDVSFLYAMQQQIKTKTIRKLFVVMFHLRHDLSLAFVMMTSVLNFPWKENRMFLAFVLVVGLAAVLIKLGAASVMVSVLSMGLHAALILIAVLAALLLWKKLSWRENQGPERSNEANSERNR